MSALGKLLCLPFKALVWLVTLPVKWVMGAAKMAFVTLLLALILAGGLAVLLLYFTDVWGSP